MTPVSAQVTGTLETGASRISFGDAGGRSVFSVAPALRWDGARASLALGGSWSRFTGSGGGSSAQGVVSGSWFPLFVGSTAIEIGASAAGTTAEGLPETSVWFGTARLHLLRRHVGGWLGGSAGRASDGVSTESLARGEGAVWARTGPATLLVTVTPTWIGSDIQHTDNELSLRIAAGRVEVTGFAGWRIWGEPVDESNATWAGVTAAVAILPRVAIVGGGGSFPIDVAQGLERGTYATLGLRLATRREPPGETASRRDEIPELGPGFRVRPVRRGRWRIEVIHPRASQVELAGDFTDWEVRPLARPRSGGPWVLDLPIAPGIHRFNVRIDGGVWEVPAGVPAVRDEFSGMVGLLQVK